MMTLLNSLIDQVSRHEFGAVLAALAAVWPLIISTQQLAAR
jgi:hypothetical protein